MKLTVYQNGIPTVLEYSTPICLSTLFAHAHMQLAMPCGGRGTCRKCKVTVRGAASPMTETEAACLTKDEREHGIRLACMTTALGDMEIVLPDTARTHILMDGQLPNFPHIPWAEGYGAAFDIGTTTVAAYLYDLAEGTLLAAHSEKNPQSAFGADVISRITHAMQGDGASLAGSIRGCINGLLTRMCRTAKISLESLGALVFTGNTAMEYLLTGADPASIAHAPFAQDRFFGEFCSAGRLCLNAPRANIYITRCISAYIGGDITSGVLSTGMASAETPVLLADIGTNGELVLASGGHLVCCSTAAGPAFEGAGIYMGTAAVDGAIAHVRAVDGALIYETIGDCTPTGICGSGVVDAVAAFLALGYIDETGAIDDLMLPDALYAEADGVPAIRFPDSNIVFTQKDIRAVQLAKSAICAGIETLLASAGLRAEDVGRLLIAGGFGNVLDVASAEAIGLIPSGFSGRVEAAGNTAGMGAVMQLLSHEKIKEAESLSRSAKTVELSRDPIFRASYMENMLFPTM